jgi:hypothetical protein
MLSRAVVEILAKPELAGALVLPGGTALNKPLTQSPSRYSQDIDLVQAKPGAVHGTAQRETQECARRTENIPNGIRDFSGLPDQSSEPGGVLETMMHNGYHGSLVVRGQAPWRIV